MTFTPTDRLVSMSVATRGSEDFYSTFQELSELATNLGVNHDYVSVSTNVISEDEDPHNEPAGEDLYYDDNTLLKVRAAVVNALSRRGSAAMALGTSDTNTMVDEIVNEMLNDGILFRERLPS